MQASRPRQLRMTLSLAILMSFVFLLIGEYELTLAWFIMFFFLLPCLIFVQRVPFLSIKVVVWFVLVTQSVTLPLFYLRAEDYEFQAHRPYNFTGLESLQIFIPLGLLSFTLVLISFVFSKLHIIKNYIRFFQNHNNILSKSKNNFNDTYLLTYSPTRGYRSHILAPLGIVAIVMIMIPVNSWMFTMGIGLAGVAPPQLPYKLSGALFYLAKFLIPLILIILYTQSNRKSYFIILVLGVYSIFLGLSTVSRGAALSVLIAPIAFSLIDKRMGLLVISIIFASVSLLLASLARNALFIVESGFSTADLSLGLIGTFFFALRGVDFVNSLLILPSIVGRFEGFQNLFMSSQFNPDAIGGTLEIFLKLIDHRLIHFDHDAMHLEMRGHTVPYGFYMGLSGFFGSAVSAINTNILYIPLFSLLAVLCLLLQELLIYRITNNYKIIKIFASLLVVGVSITFLLGPGSIIGNSVLLIILIFGIFPRVRQLYIILRAVGVSRR